MYGLTDEDRASWPELSRFAGRMVKAYEALRLFHARGGTLQRNEHLLRRFDRSRVVATFDLGRGLSYLTPDSPRRSGALRFAQLPSAANAFRDDAPIAFDDVPARVLSDVLRDVDLVMSETPDAPAES